MEEESDSENQVEFAHKKNKNYELIPATGAIGGIQPNGNYKINFVLDHNPEVIREVHEIDPETGVSKLNDIETADQYTREVMRGITMHPQDAFETAAWIISNIVEEDVSDVDVRELILEKFTPLNSGEEDA